MSLVVEDSLAQTLEAINEAQFYSRNISQDQKQQAVDFLLSRHDRKGSYAGLFAPTEADWDGPVLLFTGEKVSTGAAKSHVLGEESLRALASLDGRSRRVQQVMDSGTVEMTERLADAVDRQTEAGGRFKGEYCCGTCSVSLWRALLAETYRQVDSDRWIQAGLKSLKTHRQDNNRWRRFPFYYTVLCLLEIDQPAATEELAFAADALRRVLRRRGEDRQIIRRRDLAKKALERIG